MSRPLFVILIVCVFRDRRLRCVPGGSAGAGRNGGRACRSRLGSIDSASGAGRNAGSDRFAVADRSPADRRPKHDGFG